MGKKQGAIYEPGELNRVRGKLGDIDETEAKRMAQILGGEVGVEKDQPAAAPKKTAAVSRKTVDVSVPGRSSRRSGRPVDVAGDDDIEVGGGKTASPGQKPDTGDDPSVKLNISYRERVKMDRCAAQIEFEIKSPLQALISAVSFFNDPVDHVYARFANRRMNIYYRKIEQVVASTRNLFPRNNAKRSERLKKVSPFAFSVLNTIRNWDTERIASDLAVIQSHPRTATVAEFAEILKAVYKPLFILDKLDLHTHIKEAYKLLYKQIFNENPSEPKEKIQDIIRNTLANFSDIRRDINYVLYPLLMKHISDKCLPYEKIFIERRNRYMAFLAVTENDQIMPVDINVEQAEIANREAELESKKDAEAVEDGNEDAAAEKKAETAPADAEQKALEHGLGVLEMLFPKAGWEKLSGYPDIYPYFSNMYSLRRGYELIAQTDPVQQVAVLMHILEDMCVAMRYITFGSVTGSDGKPVNVTEAIGDTIANWRRYIDTGFVKEYLPRLSEYCRLLEHSVESRSSPYARRTLNELRWIKRLYFLPYYKFESFGPPPFQKQDVTAIYSETRKFRKILTLVAAGIETGNRNGGAAAKAMCHGIENPWAPYNFEVPNPVSKRLDALLGPGKRNNAALIFFALSVTTVLDCLLNAESSWAYSDQGGALFRSANNDGMTPLFGVDIKLDADQIFKDTLKQRMAGNTAV